MSDIKYIIAGDDNGREHTRFPCLVVVRYAVATVVTVLALAVVAMVIHAVLRSEDIRLSVNNGFIGADNLWNISYVSSQSAQRQAGAAPSSSVPSELPKSLGLPQHVVVGKRTTTVSNRDYTPSYGDDPTAYGNNGATQVTLQRANTTNLRVILIANNPGGRTRINCTDTTVTLTDMQYHYEIGTLKLNPFTVPPQTTITLQKRLKINDSTTLSHIWDNHGGAHSFGVTVRMDASVTSYPLGKAQTKTQTYVCQQVIVGLLDYEAFLATDAAECTRPDQLPS